MTFAWPWSFLLVIPLAVAAWRMLRRRRKTGIRFSAISRLPIKTNGLKARLAALAPWLFLIGAAALVIAGARPRCPLDRENRRVDAIAIAMTVDVSGSMNALDLSPANARTEKDLRTRLDVVKEMFAKFVAARPDDLIGLVTFGGYASARMPLTADHEALLHILKGVEIPSVSFDANGQPIDPDETMTAIGDGLATALERLKNADVKSRVVILLSDGVSNTGAVKPEAAAAAAAKLGIRTYTIGVGTKSGRTPFRTKDMFGRTTIQYANTSFDESQLKSIAEKTSGRYFAVNDAKGLELALEEIDALEKTTLDRTVFRRYNEYFPPFLYVGSICVLLSLLLKVLIRSTNRLSPLQKVLLFFAFLLLATAAARPRWGHSMEKIESRSRNVVVALDVSRSMLAEDVQPNRLERAKADIADLVDSLEGDRCAFVTFRRTGILMCPLTTDRGFLRSTLESVTPESAPVGETDLGAAVHTALDALNPAEGEAGAIILISDGGDLRGKVLDTASLARKRGIPIFTVGIGDPKKETTIPAADGKGVQMFKGSPVKTRLEAKTLSAIAEVSGGRYVPLATAGTAETTLGSIYRRFLRQVAAKEQAEEAELRATERFGWFLLPGLLLLLIVGMLSKGRFATRKKVRATVFTFVMGMVSLTSAADSTMVTNSITAVNAEPTSVVKATSVNEVAKREKSDVTETELWNQGVEFYQRGDVTNALATLKGLTLSREYGARAAEVTAVLEYQQALAAFKHASGQSKGFVAALENLEAAANDMQLALRAWPDSPRVNRNFTRAIDRLPELRERAHVEAVMQQLGKQDPDALLAEDVKDARKILIDFPVALTNPVAPRVIAACEVIGKRLERIADTLIPLKEIVTHSVTNEEQAATITLQIEEARTLTKSAAEKTADIDTSALEELLKIESALTRFRKLVIQPPAACDEDIMCQTNAISGVAPVNGRSWQHEALDMTRNFRAKFPAWASRYEQQYQQQVKQGDTNAVPFTKEAQDEISSLSTEIEKMQIDLTAGESMTNIPRRVLMQEESMTKLLRIRELLPKDKNGGGQAKSNQPQNNQNQNQQQQQQKQDKQSSNQADQSSQPEQPPSQSQDQQSEAQADEQKADEPQSDAAVEEILRKARERNDEHENDKKARARMHKPAANERDW